MAQKVYTQQEREAISDIVKLARFKDTDHPSIQETTAITTS